jgi:hypothetical protein
MTILRIRNTDYFIPPPTGEKLEINALDRHFTLGKGEMMELCQRI